MWSSILNHILPFLTVSVRFKLARVGSSELRRHILSPIVCVRAMRSIVKPEQDKTWRSTSFSFATHSKSMHLYRVADVWNALVPKRKWNTSSINIILLLRSGFDPLAVMKIAPLDLIRWSEGEALNGPNSLPTLREIQCYFEPQMIYMGTRDFFCWSYATQPGNRGGISPSIRLANRWIVDLIKDYVALPIHALGFKPFLDDSGHDNDPDAELVLLSESPPLVLVGDTKVAIQVEQQCWSGPYPTRDEMLKLP
eukprot:Blabericola_migrator_1__6793@NODE_3439_length_1777_cov_9_101754_g2139_i0_p1_GENE_NODE_3439_length_1777_cov_9_101754_g2139_i0NODE_3439_length_1777_cov_9_101754_g2139_i0_p1_ORF_typecomplete_len253_score14_21_NODE_3439_length_1777_cov_9_101754_g2139_i09581716